ncbi:PAS domain S-box protein [bacterium]|nr:PAS domain S-box protein [bacterium]
MVHLDVVAPVWASEGKLLAFLVLRMDAKDRLYHLIEKWPTPSASAETLLVERQGDKVVFLNELRHQSGTALSLSYPLSRLDVPAVQAVLGQQGLFEGNDYLGIPVVTYLRAIPDSPWFMVAKVNKSEILAEARRRASVIAAGVALFIIVGGIGTAYSYRRYQARLFEKMYQSERAHREAQEEFRTTLYSIGDAVVTTDREGRVHRMNPVAEHLTGWSEAEAEGEPLEEVFRIVNEETRVTVENPVTRVLREGTVVGLANHTVLIGRNGMERPIADSGAPIRGEDNAIAGVVLVFRDQTEERAAEEALREAKALLQAAMDNSQAGISIADAPSGNLRYVNDAGLEILGLTPASRAGDVNVEEYGKNWEIRDLEGNPLPTDAIPLARALLGETNSREFILRRGPGDDRIVWVNASPIRDGQDEVTAAMAVFLDVTERKRAEENLRETRDYLESLFRHANIPIIVWDAEFRIRRFNHAAEALTGRAAEEVLGESVKNLFPPDQVERSMRLVEKTRTGERLETEGIDVIRADGEVRSVLWNSATIFNKSGKAPVATIAQGRDFTNRKRAEEEREKVESQLRQAQKMEAVGRLAGGVAHDFNNMLAVITGHVEMALAAILPNGPLHSDLLEIQKAAHRSANLTRQLLAFARKQTIAPKVIDLNQAISSMLKMLGRLIGEDIDLVWKPLESRLPVKIDPVQLDQVLANLAVNARDAISGVGKMTIETGEAEFDESYCAGHPGFLPGHYAMLAVSDDGCGMDKKTLARLFEPFFTTKDQGLGTGLGLATVYGIVKQNDGFINVYSEPDEGTTFRIYFLCHELEPVQAAVAPESTGRPMGTETILLVEDEELLLKLGQRLLEELGYHVLAAESPVRALELAREYKAEIQLLLTDVIMPEMSGRDLYYKLIEVRPELKCLFMSGYTSNVIAHRGVLDEGVHFLQKPFSVNVLATKIREALED